MRYPLNVILFILQSVTGQQGITYRYINNNNAGLISKASEEVAMKIAGNYRRRQ